MPPSARPATHSGQLHALLARRARVAQRDGRTFLLTCGVPPAALIFGAMVLGGVRNDVIQHIAYVQILAGSGENCRLASQLLKLMATTLVTVDLCPASWP